MPTLKSILDTERISDAKYFASCPIENQTDKILLCLRCNNPKVEHTYHLGLSCNFDNNSNCYISKYMKKCEYCGINAELFELFDGWHVCNQCMEKST